MYVIIYIYLLNLAALHCFAVVCVVRGCVMEAMTSVGVYEYTLEPFVMADQAIDPFARV